MNSMKNIDRIADEVSGKAISFIRQYIGVTDNNDENYLFGVAVGIKTAVLLQMQQDYPMLGAPEKAVILGRVTEALETIDEVRVLKRAQYDA